MSAAEIEASCEDLAKPRWLREIQAIVDRGGPEPHEYQSLLSLIDEGAADVAAGRVPRDRIRELWADVDPREFAETMQGFGLLKPHGYAGDFEMIDRIHTRWVGAHSATTRWDSFFHAQPAPKAVRNRGDMFVSILEETHARNARARVLNVGSGPCRDVERWLRANPQASLDMECLDRDPNAIAYARDVLGANADRVRFVQRDVMRYRPEAPFDLIWSAGLFDYLSDRLFVALMKRLTGALAPGGRLIIGNFAKANPSRNYMELFGEWYLHHRSETDLLQLAREAGALDASVTSEAEGVNLFLVARAPE